MKGRVIRLRKSGFRTAAALLALILALGALLWLPGSITASSAAEAAYTDGQPEGRTEPAARPEANRKKKKATASPKPSATPRPAGTPEAAAETGVTPVPKGPIVDPQSIADYLFAWGRLPDNFLTKAEARALGWGENASYLSDVALDMSIGGDRFGNYEGRLPVKHGRQYWEADCWYVGGKRNAYRIIYDNEGHVWYTADHYETFTELFPTGTKGYVCPVTSPEPTREPKRR